MTAMRESRVPYPRHGRLWDDTLTGVQRLQRVDFLLVGLGIDPARVPDGARIEYDASTGEYRLQIINPGGHLVWARRVLRSPLDTRRGSLFTALGAIDDSLMRLRDAYAVPYARGGPIPSGSVPAPAYQRDPHMVGAGPYVRDLRLTAVSYRGRGA